MHVFIVARIIFADELHPDPYEDDPADGFQIRHGQQPHDDGRQQEPRDDRARRAENNDFLLMFLREAFRRHPDDNGIVSAK